MDAETERKARQQLVIANLQLGFCRACGIFGKFIELFYRCAQLMASESRDEKQRDNLFKAMQLFTENRLHTVTQTPRTQERKRILRSGVSAKTLDRSITTIEMSKTAADTLKKMDIKTLMDLVTRPREDLENAFGEHRLMELEFVIGQLGLRLEMHLSKSEAPPPCAF
ncbi:MAG: DNA-directed RNA polymerase subunit alpha C-terminal domain-containing protein [Patescibacteria group bacterium]